MDAHMPDLQTSSPSWLHSPLAEDPDLAEVVELFAAEMPERIANVLRHFDARRWRELQRAAHQLKGSAGSYGFAPITPAAARLEDAVREARPEQEIRQAVEELVALCARVRAGRP